MKTQNIYSEFEQLVATMDIPSIRKVGNPANGNWFLQYAGIKNALHQQYRQARDIARQIAALN